MTTLQDALELLAARDGVRITTMNAGPDRMVLDLPANTTVCWLAEAGTSVDQRNMGHTDHMGHFEVTSDGFQLAPHEGDRLLEAVSMVTAAAAEAEILPAGPITLHIGLWGAGEGAPVEIGIAAL